MIELIRTFQAIEENFFLLPTRYTGLVKNIFLVLDNSVLKLSFLPIAVDILSALSSPQACVQTSPISFTACRRLLFPREAKEIGDVCTQATSPPG